MIIQAIPVFPSAETSASKSQVVMLKVFGPVDITDTVVKRARELVLGTGSPAMIESFDWAVQSGAFVTEK